MKNPEPCGFRAAGWGRSMQPERMAFREVEFPKVSGHSLDCGFRDRRFTLPVLPEHRVAISIEEMDLSAP
ncbi:hypothetical protein OH491_23540 [Termitidicoccus mucosus]|uniref:hypothetical protein n=1 Tax=Termitidicoccus mucosus TaxID=1184151 RepID=UPI000838AA63